MNAAATWIVDATKVLTMAEINMVLADLRRRTRRSVNSRQNLVIFRLATCCGLRASEIVGLNLGDVKVGIARPYIHLRKGVAKRRRGRRVPLWWDSGTLEDVLAWKRRRRVRRPSERDRTSIATGDPRQYNLPS